MHESEPDLLEATEGALLAVADDGRVAYANREALELLGWDESLVDQPLQTIIPARLRDQHRAGFGRYLRSGESRLQGKTVRVPALLRGGGEQMVDLTIRVFRRPDGSRMAVAGLTLAELGRVPPGLKLIEDELTKRLYQLI